MYRSSMACVFCCMLRCPTLWMFTVMCFSCNRMRHNTTVTVWITFWMTELQWWAIGRWTGASWPTAAAC